MLFALIPYEKSGGVEVVYELKSTALRNKDPTKSFVCLIGLKQHERCEGCTERSIGLVIVPWTAF